MADISARDVIATAHAHASVAVFRMRHMLDEGMPTKTESDKLVVHLTQALADAVLAAAMLQSQDPHVYHNSWEV